MDTQSAFALIDQSINAFNETRKFNVSNDSHSDWLVFETRKLTWSKDDVNYLIQVLPSFDDKELISSWSIGASAWYDKSGYRHFLFQPTVSNASLEYIANNFTKALGEAFISINKIKKEEIPRVVDLENRTLR